MPHVPTSLATSWGAWAVFVSVLATQLGVPVPAAPMLILAGTLVASGAASFWQMLLAAVLAVLIADSLWFAAGRLYGRRFLNSLVRFSLSIDSTLRTARRWFERFGVPLLALSKFVPGLGLVSAPLLGTTQIEIRVFVLWDLIGATAWASFWMLGGAALQEQIGRLIVLVRANGTTVIDILAMLALGFLLYRWIRRVQFRQWLEKYHITPGQLDEMMRSAMPPVIYDARPPEVRRKEPYRIAGAVALDLDSPDRIGQLYAEHEVVVYCVCPNEATAKIIARQLRDKGFRHVRPLKGGLDAWEKHGYPVEPIPAEHLHLPADRDDIDHDMVTIRATAPE
ncbi:MULTISPECIES: DedA family protein/thiosulfate sulfurtransferase GlpE [unclassified Caballeronia]|uniref:DedA family protein/thiosulfate sulfurtransferase GlpE n=1 Tax=unclassified Caballeronia TaxID=2646786 RepID=UPI002855D4DE|nr:MULTISPECIES: DedA family protein/thiosulfate sulfurtransferase GlpE [unclassified Caballeronia]MDR5812424.1 DedA family protein/thiosulfate sulfurtransferase GlpE [Caballeronia sp. LZ033]MDR5819248.1 DedA family protein/thiosulfate sulfurtransferase GlpE [Caballeronia sp. LZ043]MDR5877045.1 DedA family protein/thiosulfate sulfurtransferase GlpE [Caballeronia sp. LZ032]